MFLKHFYQSQWDEIASSILIIYIYTNKSLKDWYLVYDLLLENDDIEILACLW